MKRGYDFDSHESTTGNASLYLNGFAATGSVKNLQAIRSITL
jgi:hypothetical protein